MNKHNQNLASQYISLTYFTLGLAMCTLCINHSEKVFRKATGDIIVCINHAQTTNNITEEGNAMYVHFLQ